jgi:putative pre-16S rRNA nuclease
MKANLPIRLLLNISSNNGKEVFMRIMALDFGSHRIGVALADDEIRIATPRQVIERKDDEQLIIEIAACIKEFKVEKILVGLPKTLRGELGIQAGKVQEFVDLLKKHFTIEIILWDERYSTVEATRRLKEHYKARKIKKVIDASAAALILQSYLDQSQESSEQQ